MLPDPKRYIEHLEAICRGYRENVAQGEDWARTPCEIMEKWLALLRRGNISASEATELVRRCDEHQMSKGGIAFFMMCNTIREWYRETYECELRETIEQRRDLA
jgi:hypothetical protein